MHRSGLTVQTSGRRRRENRPPYELPHRTPDTRYNPYGSTTNKCPRLPRISFREVTTGFARSKVSKQASDLVLEHYKALTSAIDQQLLTTRTQWTQKVTCMSTLNKKTKTIFCWSWSFDCKKGWTNEGNPPVKKREKALPTTRLF